MEGRLALGLVVGGRGVEVGVERDLGVDDDLAAADEVDDQIRPQGAILQPDLLAEVAPVDEPGQLDGATEVELAPAPPHLGASQGGG
jgi:hypothetical protein